MSHEKKNRHTAILLCTYNGDRFLSQQLESYAKQTHKDYSLYVSDDGSNDETLEILEKFKNKNTSTKITISTGPQKGFSANFFSLINDQSIQANYYAFSDQDDVWMNDKLERSIKVLENLPKDTPALYCGRTYLVDTEKKPLGMSPLFTKPPCFSNALMQNIGGGNTMVMNNAARKILLLAGKEIDVVSHDWWVYLAITGCGGNVFYDKVPALYYRQHEKNIIGSNSSWHARFSRIKRLLIEGSLREWNTLNIKALKKIHLHLTDENKKTLNLYILARRRNLSLRFFGFLKSGVHRQTITGNIALIAAALLRKI